VTALHEAEQERRSLAEQLHRSQKLEAMGRLAGGVAHDFNNLLTVIRGNGEFLGTELEGAQPALREALAEIQVASERAAGLTRQLLAFSAREVVRTAVVELDEVIRDLEKLLRRMIGEDVSLVVECEPQLPPIRADRAQVEQVVVNLAVNARDAMPEGGRLWLEVRSRGAGVVLAVSDTGCGMSGEIQERIFDPFFTTKEAGRGSGLGLSTVFGIVQQWGGEITVESSPGQGTRFEIGFPATRCEDAADRDEDLEPGRRAFGGTVLVVEDEALVSGLVRRILESEGFEVLQAADGSEAVERAASHPGPIDVLLCDVVLPGLDGVAVEAAVRARRPGIRSLLMSGYSRRPASTRPLVPDDATLIQKPFTRAELRRAIRRCLERE
jgi:CheY-like chemotaxis protein